jgi:hypothetical protein
MIPSVGFLTTESFFFLGDVLIFISEQERGFVEHHFALQFSPRAWP